MTRFDVKILGCGSAMPTTLHNPSSQLVNANEKIFMIDCGEGTQLQMRKFKTRISKLHSIFISHLHGDHVLGIPGLVSTLNMLGRKGDLNIYAPKEIEPLFSATLEFFCPHREFQVHLFPLNDKEFNLLYENKSLRIYSFPLKHRIPTCGFLFEEKEKPRHIKREMIDFHQIPIHQIKAIKAGADFVTDKGKVIPNDMLTSPANPPRRYAYCSDTAYYPDIIPYIEGVDVLYHEATFAEAEAVRAQQTFHSTARQAAEIAQAAGVKKLLLGHFSARYTELNDLLREAQAIFPNTHLTFEGMDIIL
ncbi:ribonuclease Z [Anaerorudis cellulosivorans]|uniref:ribonuclease Z n=1 Tax=Anaerorudis cellulosivorans TaxID=3397862 RepID=UPI0022205099|nr:ribonuclease Z [Seramator thermalis]MCW1735549.1 ribonuclease Z [Seramator thermalis]